jgi:galactokinase
VGGSGSGEPDRGTHDYNDGFVMPFALDQRVTVAAGPRNRNSWSVTTLRSDETRTFGMDRPA